MIQLLAIYLKLLVASSWLRCVINSTNYQGRDSNLVLSISGVALSHFTLSKVLTGILVLNPPVVAVDGGIVSVGLKII